MASPLVFLELITLSLVGRDERLGFGLLGKLESTVSKDQDGKGDEKSHCVCLLSVFKK